MARRLSDAWQTQQPHSVLQPDVMSLAHWIKSSYVYSNRPTHQVLSSWQQLQLWIEAVKKTPSLSTASLLPLAKFYQQKWNRHSLSMSTKASEDEYLQCERIYLDLCAQYFYVDIPQLIDSFPSWYTYSSDTKFVFHGFTWSTEALRSLLSHLPSSALYSLPASSTAHHFYSYKYVDEELDGTALMIASVLETQPNSIHAVVVYDDLLLDDMYNRLLQICYSTDYHESYLSHPKIDRSRISSLSSTPLMSAIDVLLCIDPDENARLIPKLFQYSYFRHPDHLDFFSLLSSLVFPSHQCCQQAFSVLQNALQHHAYFESFTTKYLPLIHSARPTMLTWEDWCLWAKERISIFLPTTLSAIDCDLLTQLYSLLHQECAHGLVLANDAMSFSTWHTYFHALLDSSFTHHQKNHTSIYLTTWQDALAIPCDYQWNVGVHAGVMPASDSHESSSLQDWRAIFSYHRSFADVCYVSYALMDMQEQALLHSPLIDHSLYLPKHTDYAQHPFILDDSCEILTCDDDNIAITADERKISTQVLKNYSLCACKGFISHRLHVREKEQHPVGFSPKDIGILVHDTLQHWFIPKKQIVKSDLSTWVEKRIAASSWDWQPSTHQRLVLVEHIVDVAYKWLTFSYALHSDEVAFTSKHEVAFSTTVGQLELRMRVDRIDYVDNAARVVDYKTGRVFRHAWSGPKMHDPQLPFYALMVPNTQCITYASLHPQQWSYQGVSANPSKVSGIIPVDKFSNELSTWDEWLDYWRDQLHVLSSQYYVGKKTLNPIDSNTCDRCAFSNICRRFEH